MFDFIRGILHSVKPLLATIDVQGIGYKLFIPPTTYAKLPHPGKEVTLYTSLIIRENSHNLYGFGTEQERDLFEVLITVSGIGPKMGLALVGHLPLKELLSSIANADTSRLCKVPGVGKKTAERLIIEVKDKLPALFGSAEEISLHHPLLEDALNTLLHLGYQRATAKKAIEKTLEKAPEISDLSQLITQSLRNI